MGDGADFDETGGGYAGGHQQPPGEYYGGMPGQAPPGWQPAQPQYAQPVYQQPQYAQPVYQPPPPPRRRRQRKVSEYEQRALIARCYEELLDAPIFSDPNDPVAMKVQEEVYAFAERRIAECFGAPVQHQPTAFSKEETAALRLLAQRMLAVENDDSPAAEEPPAAPAAPPRAARAPVRDPEPVESDEGLDEEGQEEAQPAYQPPPQPRQQPMPVQAPPAPQGGARVVPRLSAAQRAALLQRTPQQRPQQPRQPVPQQVTHSGQFIPPATIPGIPGAQHMVTEQPAQAPAAQPARRGRGRRGQPEPAPPRAVAPPPTRFAMPQGSAMTAVSAMQAQSTIEHGGTVLSETFVKAPTR